MDMPLAAQQPARSNPLRSGWPCDGLDDGEAGVAHTVQAPDPLSATAIRGNRPGAVGSLH